MKESRLLAIASFLAVALLWIHVADDMVRGLDRVGTRNMFGVLFSVVWLYAALVAQDRRWAKVLLFLLALLGTVVPVLHLRGGLPQDFLASSGAMLFLFTLYALGITSGLAAVLAGRALFRRSTLSATPVS